ncbi:MAG: hypothetical protein NT062_31640 [Proteobacteria bacterium]|nr:hypothetical protein [Pseudomonadota bacterium]
MLRFVALISLAACSSSPSTATKALPEAGLPVVADAGVPPIDGITAIGNFDPASGMHLDDDAPSRPTPSTTGPRRPGRPIEVTLRSSPPGASATVDGLALGPTPAFWAGEANGHEHTFTFTLRRHATAVYRFVPVTSGVVHARLEPLTGPEETGPKPAPEPPEPAPITPPPPPATIVTPRPVAPPPSIDAGESTPIDAGAVPAPSDASAPLPDAGDLGGNPFR